MTSQTDSIERSYKSGDVKLAALIEEFGKLVEQRAKSEDIERFIKSHPADATQLREILPTLRTLSRLAEPGVKKDSSATNPLPYGVLGDFRVLREIGRGGMGIVYLAEQMSLPRQVALKILPLAAVMDSRHLQRFRNEVQAAALLQHTNIVPIYSVGSDKGVHFFAMQFVDGHSLAKVIAQLRDAQGAKSELSTTNKRPTARPTNVERSPDSVGGGSESMPSPSSSPGIARTTDPAAVRSTIRSSRPNLAHYRSLAKLMIQAAHALEHAHERGILHRDIKPANLLVDHTETLWITDFGLARLGDDSGLTVTGDLIGTLRYMSPEQTLAKRSVVDHRTDIYSLGATLYELLTLRPVHDGADRGELLRKIAFDEPRRPRRINESIPIELETITLKALEKDPADRYSTAQEMAADLQRFIDHRPVRARRPSITTYIAKWSRRHVGIVWTLLVAAILLAGTMAIGALVIYESREEAEQQRQLAEGERKLAVDQRNAARQNQYDAHMVAGQLQSSDNNPGGLLKQMAQYQPLDGELDLRDWEWYYLMSQLRRDHQTIYQSSRGMYVMWSPDGDLLASGGLIWEAATGKLLRRFDMSLLLTNRGAWSPGGQQFAWGCTDDDVSIYIWDRQSDRIRRIADKNTWSLAWSPDGQFLANGTYDGTQPTISVFEAATLQRIRLINVEEPVVDLEWSPDGKLLAAAISNRGVQVWSTSTWQMVAKPSTSRGLQFRMDWHPSGDRLVVVERNRRFYLNCSDWSVQQEQRVSRGGDVAWSPDGKHLAFVQGERVTIVNEEDELETELIGHRRPIVSVSWALDNHRIVTSDGQRETKTWELGQLAHKVNFRFDESVHGLYWQNDQTILATNAEEHEIRQVQITQSSTPESRISSPTSITFSAKLREPWQYAPLTQRFSSLEFDERESGGWDFNFRVWDFSTGAHLAEFATPTDQIVHRYRLSPDASRIVVHGQKDLRRMLTVWDVESESPISDWSDDLRQASAGGPVRFLEWSPLGAKFLAVGVGDAGENGRTYWKHHVHVYDSATGKRLANRLTADETDIESIAWSPDDEWIAMGTFIGGVSVFHADRGARKFYQKVHSETVTAIAFHPSGNRLACATQDGYVKLISNDNGETLLTFRVPGIDVRFLAWSPNGRRLAACASDGTAVVWDATNGYRQYGVSGPSSDVAWTFLDRAQESSGEVRRMALRAFLRYAPDSPNHWIARGNVSASLDEFQRAEQEFAKAINPMLDESFATGRMRALAVLGSGDTDRFGKLTAELFETFRDSTIGANVYFVCKLAALSSSEHIDGKELLESMNLLISREGDEIEFDQWGEGLYRAGRFTEAAAQLTRRVKERQRGGQKSDLYERAYYQYFLAMARFQLGHQHQARRHFKEATVAAREFFESDLTIDRLRRWRLEVELKALRREASSLIDMK